MVSQVHTITNKSRLAIGPVRGLPGYNPLLTGIRFCIQKSHMVVTFFLHSDYSEAQSGMVLVIY